MQYKNIIAFDGMPGAGKTTILDSLIKNYSSFLIAQSSIDDSVYKNSPDSIIASIFIDLEQQKSDSFKVIKNKDNIFLDRSYLSIIAFYYAKSLFLKTKDSCDVFELVSNQLLKKVKDKEIIQPNKLIILLVGVRESLIRRKEFSSLSKYYPWFEEEFLSAMFDFYKQEKYKLYFKGEVCILDTTFLTIDEVKIKVKNFFI